MNEQTPLISIIIPYYNCKDYIEETLQSIKNQTYSNYEVILVNDGSDEINTTFIEKLLEDKSHIQYIYQENRGASSARNAGAKIAQGEFLLFLDADNKIHPTYLEKTSTILINNPNCKIAYTKAELFEAQTGEWILPPYDGLTSLLQGNMIAMLALTRKSDFIKLGGFDENLHTHEDWDYWIRLLQDGGDVIRLDDILFSYRKRFNKTSLTDMSSKNQQNMKMDWQKIYIKHNHLYLSHDLGYFNLITSNQHYLCKNHALTSQLSQLNASTLHLTKYERLIIIKLLKPIIKFEQSLHSLNHYRKGFRKLMKYKGSFGKAYQAVRRTYKKYGMESAKQLLKNSLIEQYDPILAIKRNTQRIKKNTNFSPKVSVIVPNYNHSKYLPKRLDSILNQSYKNIELIILDDKSSDNSIKIINDYFLDKSVTYTLIANEINSGNVFKQWRKGIEQASGDLIWICESDDFCENDFLENIVPCFEELSVQLAFGRIQFCDKDGNFQDGLDSYRQNAESDIWNHDCIRPAFEWFNNAFGVNNVFANASGGVFRRQTLDDDTWQKACEFKICGDWFLYLKLSGGGKIAYISSAISYFRQHDTNTSASNFNQLYYYEEHFKILNEIKKMWNINQKTQSRFINQVKEQYIHFSMQKTYGDFNVKFHNDINHHSQQEKLHIQIYFLGFHIGGGELFPIHLANQLHDIGHTVSMVALNLEHINTGMQAKLKKNIAVYIINDLYTNTNFLKDAGVDIIHTHIAGADKYLSEYLLTKTLSIPYIVTMHGSHDRSFADYNINSTKKMLETIDLWVYTTDKNLNYFFDVNIPNIKKLPNAMPIDDTIANSSRESLGIAKTDIIFTFAARGIFEKGCIELITAFLEVQQEDNIKDIHLILIGSGDAQIKAQSIANDNPNIHFLGYESAVNSVLRYSDCLILPTRFAGESYPLILIQAIQEGLPCIATDIGEIKNMIQNGNNMSGILLTNTDDNNVFIPELKNAIRQMCNKDVYNHYKNNVKGIANRYDMKALTQQYINLYQHIIQKHATNKETL